MRQLIKIKPIPLSKINRLPKKALIILAVVIVTGVSLGIVLNRNSASTSAVAELQIAAVERGDLTSEITAAGNLALGLTEDLAFEIAGTVEDVLVEVGDTIEEGQLLATLDTAGWDKELATLQSAVLQAEVSLENTREALGAAKEQYFITVIDMSQATTTDWCMEVEIKELEVELAELRLDDAIKELEEALEHSPEITAPFAGFITQVMVAGGDEVQKGTVAVQLADPEKFEADILVSEVEIENVTLGGQAWVSIEALDGLTLPAEVTHISPTATISSGVVNYNVEVEVASLEDYLQEQQELMQQAMPDFSSGELPAQLQQAVDEGSMTEEEANAMIEQMQQGRENRPETTATFLENIQLREGLTITVTIVVSEANDVLLVPVLAVMQRGTETYVQVMSADSEIEERTIITGVSNWQYTEVTDGLSEGEQVVLPEGATTATTGSDRGSQRGMMMPGMGVVVR